MSLHVNRRLKNHGTPDRPAAYFGALPATSRRRSRYRYRSPNFPALLPGARRLEGPGQGISGRVAYDWLWRAAVAPATNERDALGIGLSGYQIKDAPEDIFHNGKSPDDDARSTLIARKGYPRHAESKPSPRKRSRCPPHSHRAYAASWACRGSFDAVDDRTTLR